jgi:hypothetical protein
VAANILQCSAEATACFGQSTLAKGSAEQRTLGVKPPSGVARTARELDVAASLLRHPTAAADAITKIQDYISDISTSGATPTTAALSVATTCT